MDEVNLRSREIYFKYKRFEYRKIFMNFIKSLIKEILACPRYADDFHGLALMRDKIAASCNREKETP